MQAARALDLKNKPPPDMLVEILVPNPERSLTLLTLPKLTFIFIDGGFVNGRCWEEISPDSGIILTGFSGGALVGTRAFADNPDLQKNSPQQFS